MKVGLLLRTLAHLRWEQIVYRPIRIAQTKLDRLSLFSNLSGDSIAHHTPPGAVEIFSRVFDSLPHLNPPLAQYDARINDLKEDRFTFLNQTLTLTPLDWNHRYESHLWNYHLHYFGYAVWSARAFVERKDSEALSTLERLITSWDKQAKVGLSDGWAAYPLSLRIVNWAFAYSLIAAQRPDFAGLKEWSASIHRQVDFLSRRIEHHLLGNHLIKNAKAILVGGLLFSEERWLELGERLLWQELEEQVLADGGHFERSPMYHSQILADYLECLALLVAFDRIDQERRKWVAAKLTRMAQFLQFMSYPDGTTALFNDSANSEEFRARPILASAELLGGKAPAEFAFPDTGYFGWVSTDGRERIVVDAGPPAAEYNTAHAHCDLLSYELWLNGRPFIVDSGVHGYEGDPFREYARSTRAHNTVAFDGREQSEVWGTFRMARRASIESVEAQTKEDSWTFRAAYRPYYDRRLIHTRRIERAESGEWVVVDICSGAGARSAESFIHLHPDMRARKLDDLTIECRSESGRVRVVPFGVDSVEIVTGSHAPVQGWYFPDFGIARPSQTICLRAKVNEGVEFGYRCKVQSAKC